MILSSKNRYSGRMDQDDSATEVADMKDALETVLKQEEDAIVRSRGWRELYIFNGKGKFIYQN